MTETEACKNEIQRRAPFQSAAKRKSYSLVESFILFCKTALMRSAASSPAESHIKAAPDADAQIFQPVSYFFMEIALGFYSTDPGRAESPPLLFLILHQWVLWPLPSSPE